MGLSKAADNGVDHVFMNAMNSPYYHFEPNAQSTNV